MTNSNLDEIQPNTPTPKNGIKKNVDETGSKNPPPQILPFSSGSQKEKTTGDQFVVKKSVAGPSCGTDKEEGEEQLVEERISYKEFCETDLSKKTFVLQQMKINERGYYSIRKAFGHPEEVIQTTRPNISYRRPISAEKKRALLNNMIEKGIVDNFGHIVVVRNEDGDLVVVDGCQRVDALSDALKRGVVGLGKLKNKKPSDFRYHMKKLPVTMLIPVDFKPISDEELLGISIALNVGESTSLALSDEDVCRMLINFIKCTLGKKSKEHYLLHLSDMVDKTTRFNILDHLFSRKVRDENDGNSSGLNAMKNSRRRISYSVAQRNRRET